MARFRYCAVSVWPPPASARSLYEQQRAPELRVSRNESALRGGCDPCGQAYPGRRRLQAVALPARPGRFPATLIASRLHIPLESIVQRLDALAATLGRVFRDMQPYALFPVVSYFSTRISGGARPCVPVPAVRVQVRGGPVRPPLVVSE